MALTTKGFGNARRLNAHFQAHGSDFGASSASDYEKQADMFLSGNVPPNVHECFRKKGDIIRYDPQTEAFGVLDTQKVIRTFFQPVPCAKVPKPSRAAARRTGQCHGHANNFTYFRAECRKW